MGGGTGRRGGAERGVSQSGSNVRVPDELKGEQVTKKAAIP